MWEAASSSPVRMWKVSVLKIPVDKSLTANFPLENVIILQKNVNILRKWRILPQNHFAFYFCLKKGETFVISF